MYDTSDIRKGLKVLKVRKGIKVIKETLAPPIA